jgi:hypothetical protein
MIELFLLLKGKFYEQMYTFTTCCGGPLGSSPAPCLKYRSFQTRDFKILKN